MASNSVSVSCHKTMSLIAGVGPNAAGTSNQTKMVSFPPSSSIPTQKSLSFGSSSNFVCPARKLSAVAKLNAQLNEIANEKSSNSALVLDTNSNSGKGSTELNVPDASSIDAFMGQVSELVKLVDSRDVVELHLKQMNCEVTIRKKEALKQPDAAAPVFTIPPSYPQAMFPTPPAAAPSPTPAPASAPAAAPTPAQPSPVKKSSSSSHPPLKCPMAGTFYRSPAPSEPPFVKVGDKVQKGQVVCIVEAMKLMNEIEADQSGTITEILVEDGKPVSVDMPLFIVAP